MRTASQSHTADSIFTSLGYPDPMVAARQQARVILLGRKSRYQAEILFPSVRTTPKERTVPGVNCNGCSAGARQYHNLILMRWEQQLFYEVCRGVSV